MDFDVVIVRCLFIDGRFVDNLCATLVSGGVRFDDIKSGRRLVYVKTGDVRAPSAISKVPGVVSCSPAIFVGGTAEEAASFLADVAKSIPAGPGHASYLKLAPEAIGRVHRGAVLRAVKERRPDVRLNNAKSRVHVELSGSGAYVFTDIVPGTK